MKVVFAHDHIFFKYLNEYYSNGELSREMLLRYITNFGEVKILTRQRKIDELNSKLSLSTTPGAEFIEVPNFKSIKTYHKINMAREVIEKEIDAADCLVARVSSIGLLAIECAVRKNKPYIVEVTGCSWDTMWNYGNLQSKIYAIYNYIKTKKLVHNAPYVIYVTDKFLQKRYPTLGVNTSCSNVVVSDFSEEILEKRLKKIANRDGKLVLGTIGALSSKYKGFDTVIKTLEIIRSRIDVNIEYRLLGGGDSEYIKELAKRHGVGDLVKFDGTLPNGKPVFNWLDNIDIYIQPSRAEGLPRAVIEAMSRGCPVFGSDVGGIPELLDEKCIFHRSNYRQLSDILTKNMFNQDWLRNQAQRNFEEAKKYDKKKIELQRNDFFKRFINDMKVSV